MNNKVLTIKVSDLLNKLGKTDSISFENVLLKNIPNLDPEWISGEIILQSVNDDSLFAEVKNINCKTHEICDLCTNEYTTEYKDINYEWRFQTEDTLSEDNDEIFPIDDKWLINIEDLLTQSILLNDSFSKICPKCKDKQREDTDENLYDDFNWWANVYFSFKK